LLGGEKREPTAWESYHLADAILLLEVRFYREGEDAMMSAERADAFEPTGWTSADHAHSLRDLRFAIDRALRGDR